MVRCNGCTRGAFDLVDEDPAQPHIDEKRLPSDDES